MADYRQDCPTPGCSYTGFSGHSPGCPVPMQQAQYERERKQKRDAEDKAWKEFFDGMTEAELFTYKKDCENEIAAVYRFKKRLDRINDYMRWDRRGLLRKYLDWCANR